MLRRIVFSVDLSCSQTSQSAVETQTSIRGETYDDEPDWACVSEGSFKFELDTARGRKHWEYSFSVPISVAVLGKERIEIRLLFQRKDRRVVEQLAKGMSMEEYVGKTSEKHEIALRLEGDMIVRVPIDNSFLLLLAKWEEPTVPSA